jgi:hypothetical protein
MERRGLRMAEETRAERRQNERDAYRKDAVAEQGLASTIRKLQAGGYTLMFPPGVPAIEGNDPPFKIAIGRVVQGLGFIHYGVEYTPETLKDDKELAYALALTLHGYGYYEREALHSAGLAPSPEGKDKNGGGGGKRIILTDG